MAETKRGNWTDAEKLGLLFQIIDKGGKIPWADLVLPPGRTKKACEVMISVERQKVKAGSGGETKKRGNGKDSIDESPAKKSKTTRGKRATSPAQDDSDSEPSFKKASEDDEDKPFT